MISILTSHPLIPAYDMVITIHVDVSNDLRHHLQDSAPGHWNLAELWLPAPDQRARKGSAKSGRSHPLAAPWYTNLSIRIIQKFNCQAVNLKIVMFIVSAKLLITDLSKLKLAQHKQIWACSLAKKGKKSGTHFRLFSISLEGTLWPSHTFPTVQKIHWQSKLTTSFLWCFLLAHTLAKYINIISTYLYNLSTSNLALCQRMLCHHETDSSAFVHVPPWAVPELTPSWQESCEVRKSRHVKLWTRHTLHIESSQWMTICSYFTFVLHEITIEYDRCTNQNQICWNLLIWRVFSESNGNGLPCKTWIYVEKSCSIVHVTLLKQIHMCSVLSPVRSLRFMNPI